MVKTIIDIQNRKSKYTDILEHRKEGQNIYHLSGNNRATFIPLTTTHRQVNDFNATKAIDVPPRVITGMRTIPNSNLAGRKRDVLEIHQENLRMVKRLAHLDAQQGILNREVSPENVFWFRSKSHRSKHRSRSNSLTK